MVAPLKGFDPKTLMGSIEDNRFLVCVGSSGSFYSLGVLVRTDDSMHVAFIPPENAEHMDTYFSLIEDIRRKEFRYHIMEYCNATETKGCHWEVYGGCPGSA